MSDSDDKIAKAAEQAASRAAEKVSKSESDVTAITGRDWTRAIPLLAVLSAVFTAGGLYVTLDAVKQSVQELSASVKEYSRATDTRVRRLEDNEIRRAAETSRLDVDEARGRRRPRP